MAQDRRDTEAARAHQAPDAPITVGVNDSASALLAVEWAALEAARLGCPLRMVHAFPADALHEPPGKPIGRERAELAFDAARERLTGAALADLPISTVAHQGSARRVLLHEATSARMLVLGREHVGRLAELVLASTSMSCATQAVTPVTVVPMTWLPADAEKKATVLGLDGSPRSLPAMEHAFGVAAQGTGQLFVVVALDQPVGFPQGWPLGGYPERTVRADAVLESLAPWRERFPEVDVEVVIDERSPVEALADYGGKAERLVIGGRGHGLVTGALLGSVARAVIRHTPCPVTVAHAHRKGAGDDEHE